VDGGEKERFQIDATAQRQSGPNVGGSAEAVSGHVQFKTHRQVIQTAVQYAEQKPRPMGITGAGRSQPYGDAAIGCRAARSLSERRGKRNGPVRLGSVAADPGDAGPAQPSDYLAGCCSSLRRR
jgi:hypothetical protein